jgi:cysteine desulfurase
LVGCAPSEIFFTSGGTESDNTAIMSSVQAYGIKHIISSPLEHHAVTHTIDYLVKLGVVEAHWVNHDAFGVLDLSHLEQLLQQYPKSLVSIMHANNELGNINDIETIAALCQTYEAWFHTDAVQTLGKLPFHLDALNVHYLAGAAHKFHGPKGVGLLYIKAGHAIPPMVHGGAQERNMRGGTENTAGIVGLAKALELSYQHQATTWAHTLSLRQLMREQLTQLMPEMQFNGLSGQDDNCVPHVLNLSLPPAEDGDMLLFNLDIAGIAASGGSACSSGSLVGSHVIRSLREIQKNPMLDLRPAIRFSFSKYNTAEEVSFAASQLAQLYSSTPVLS